MGQNERQQLVSECRASGLTAKAWCEMKGIPYRQYIGWATRLNRQAKQKPQQWVELNITSSGSVDEVKVKCGKWTIHVQAGFDPALLADIIRVVDGVC